jgi:hypothetical protein
MNLNLLDKKKKMIIFSILLFLCFSGILGIMYEYTFKYFFVQSSQSYLDDTINKSTDIFLSLSAIKAFTAIIEGSEIGVNAFGQFSLQVGDIVQSLYDIIDIMWKVSFVGVVALSIQKIFLEYFPTILLSHMVGIATLFYLPSLFYENFIVSFFRKTSKFIVILFASVYFLIPFNIFIASKTSEYLDYNYFKPAIIKLQVETDKLSTLTTKLEKIEVNKSENDIKKETKWYDFGSTVSNSVNNLTNEVKTIFNNLKEIQGELETITSNILKVAVTIVTIYITNAILLPLIFLGLTYIFIQIVFLGQDNVIRKKSFKVIPNNKEVKRL